MKKINLKAVQIGAGEILSREQLKNVLGGDGGSSDNHNYVVCIYSWECGTLKKDCPDGTVVELPGSCEYGELEHQKTCQWPNYQCPQPF